MIGVKFGVKLLKRLIKRTFVVRILLAQGIKKETVEPFLFLFPGRTFENGAAALTLSKTCEAGLGRRAPALRFSRPVKKYQLSTHSVGS